MLSCEIFGMESFSGPSKICVHQGIPHSLCLPHLYLPWTLKSLHIVHFHGTVSQLPAGLQSFRSNSDMCGITALPPDLKVLNVADARKLDFTTLPENLTELSFSIPPKSGNIQLPPHLKSLQLQLQHQFNLPLPSLPASLTTLAFHNSWHVGFPLPPLPSGL
jgi:hypothetical protein